MKGLFTVLITLSLFALGFGLYMLIPFKKKTGQIVVVSIAAAIAIIMIVIPAKAICSIDIPILNRSANQIIDDFVTSIDQYNTVLMLSPDLANELVNMVPNIVKGVITFIVEGIYLLLASLVTTIVYLAKKKKKDQKKKPVRAISANLGCIVMSFVFFLVPVSGIANIYSNLNKVLGIEKVLYEEYPKLKKYAKMIDFVDGAAQILDTGFVIDDIPLLAIDAFSGGAASGISDSLFVADELLYNFEKSNILALYDDNFTFAAFDTNDIVKDNLDLALEFARGNEAYEKIILSIFNGITNSISKQAEVDFGIKNIDLTYSIGEIETGYDRLLEVVSFVGKLGLVNQAKILIPRLIELIEELIDIMEEIMKYVENPKDIFKNLSNLVGNVKDLVNEALNLLDTAKPLLSNLLGDANKVKTLNNIMSNKIIYNMTNHMKWDIDKEVEIHGVKINIGRALTSVYLCYKLDEIEERWKNSEEYISTKQFLTIRG